ncbi:hypothetical protein TWF106_004862 [Orbilia oligospora]|uniref:WLM domain-containing protein n=1 Tax=Orbilia oligospora TaxID=2813651 RepID=A0A7C8UNE0_ORBOL|nr:hypothetical protein TWF106_004862 [Orbilia oligospora]
MVTTHILNDPDALIGTFFHLANYPNASFAIQTLQRVASLVKPIMRRHSFRIAKLAEFYPEMETNLLGLNTSFPGTSNLPIIQLRLRQPRDPRIFLPYESIVQTMLHELTHCVHGPHDDKFWKMFRSLQGELETLKYTGYTGEGFMGKGEALGGVPKGLSNHEAKKKAREAAEKRRKTVQGRGRILGSGSLGPIKWLIEDRPGGSSTLKPKDGAGKNRNATGAAPPINNAPSPYATPQGTAAEAALKRQWEKEREKDKRRVSGPVREIQPPSRPQEGLCSGVRHSTAEAIEREIAQMHGFESVAHMENANERAIMLAAIELLEEADREEEKIKAREREQQNQSQPSSSSRGPREVIDLTGSVIDLTGSVTPRNIQRTQSAPVLPGHSVSTVPIVSPGWSCSVCTFRNEESHLQCSLCRVERNTKPHDDSETKAQIIALKDFERRKVERTQTFNTGKGKGVDRSMPQSTSTPSGSSGGDSGSLRRDITIHGLPTWKCHSCGWFVRQEWWTCSNCGTMKLES